MAGQYVPSHGAALPSQYFPLLKQTEQFPRGCSPRIAARGNAGGGERPCLCGGEPMGPDSMEKVHLAWGSPGVMVLDPQKEAGSDAVVA